MYKYITLGYERPGDATPVEYIQVGQEERRAKYTDRDSDRGKRQDRRDGGEIYG